MTEPTSLQDEIKQTRPFQSKGQEAALALSRTADQLRRFWTRVFSDSGITHQQYNVLRILRGAGDEGLPTLSIADRMIEHAPGITRLIDRLVAKELVIRERLAGDRRRVQCFISPQGLELLTSLDPPLKRAEEQVMADLDTGELEQLVNILAKMRQSFRDRGLI